MPVVSSLEKGRSEEQPKTPIELKFLFVYHELVNVDQVFKKFQNADVLIVELVAETEKAQREKGEDYNFVLKPETELGSGEVQKREKLVKELSSSDLIWDRVIAKLAGTGKEAYVVDITAEHESFPDVEEADIVDWDLKKALTHGDIEGAYKKYKEFIDIYAAVNPKREAHVVDQLEEIIPKIPEGKKATIAQGVAHTSTRFRAQEALGNKAAISMEFGNPDIIHFTALRIARLKAALGEEAKIEEEDYRWGLLGDDIFWRGMDYGPASHLSHEMQTRLAVELAQSLEPDEVEGIYRNFPKDYQEARERLLAEKGRGVVFPSDIFKETVAELTKVWIKKKGLQIPAESSTDPAKA